MIIKVSPSTYINYDEAKKTASVVSSLKPMVSDVSVEKPVEPVKKTAIERTIVVGDRKFRILCNTEAEFLARQELLNKSLSSSALGDELIRVEVEK